MDEVELLEQMIHGKIDSETIRLALLAKSFIDGFDLSVNQALSLAQRCVELETMGDEARFNAEDYVDAIVHWIGTVDLEAVETLSFEKFEKLAIYMASEKRKTYSGEYTHEPIPYWASGILH